MASLPPLDLNNIQGDILQGLAKKRQTFVFFRIGNVSTFRTHLASFLPLIASVTDAKALQSSIAKTKRDAARQGRKAALLDMSAVNISFSKKGLTALGITDSTGDIGFESGQLADAESLGDQLPEWDNRFIEGEIHGVILVTANCDAILDQALKQVEDVFRVGQYDGSIEEVIRLGGQTRPGAEDGHEHFGFLDGISQPAVKDVDAGAAPIENEAPIRQGVILTGREGDNVARPSWAVDGSFLAFRYLRQLVPEFDAFLEEKALEFGPNPPADGDPAGAELLGARLVGRWKSGAPVDITPLRDDPNLATAQNFRFDPNSQERCPFAAHIRKTNPRADLDAFGGTEIRRILRRGIQFGPEVSDEEKASKKSSDDAALERGLLFVAYQANLSQGFQFMQKSWANTATFPPGKNTPPTNPPVERPEGPGIDPIIGVGINTPRAMVGADPDIADANNLLEFENRWVIPRGGEYFFSPSIEALKTTFAGSAGEL